MSKKVDVDWENLPLGKISDGQIAKRAGIAKITVARQRRKRGIPAFVSPTSTRANGKVDIDWENLPLGKIPDGQIAQRVGLAGATVGRYRNKMGIEPFSPSTVDAVCECGANYKAIKGDMNHKHCGEGCRSGVHYHGKMNYPEEMLVAYLNLKKLKKEIKKRSN